MKKRRKTMRIVVFGAGAVGSLIGGRLLEAGSSVRLVGRPPHVAAIRERGLILEDSPAMTLHPEAVDRLNEGTDADGVLLTVKCFDLEAAADEISRIFPEGVPVFALQNGLGIESRLVDRFTVRGWKTAGQMVVRAVSSVPATLVSPGVVRPGGAGEILLAGVDGMAVPPVAERLRVLLEDAGIPVRLVPDVAREVWRKAIINAAINPVTADHGILNGWLLRDPWRGQAKGLLLEACTAARLAGFEFQEAEIEADLWTVVRATAANRSSMLQDLDRGRPTEIDTISGAIVAVARQNGLELPATERAVARIRERVRRAARPYVNGNAQAS